ncbi:hypothetical protein NC652_034431 [Populus alba x Populus x berolinensis]|nr:hypothetical protein NC652_034431 [Populus alba x Populus x berolinensis]
MEKSSMKMAFFVVLLVFAAALFNGYARHGLGSEAVMLFKNMLEKKVVPDGATVVGNFICLWLGMRFFYSMDEYYGVTPNLEHLHLWAVFFRILDNDSWLAIPKAKLIVELYKEAQFSFRISLENAAPSFALICGKQLSIIVYSTSWRIPKGMPTRFGSCRNPRI